MDFGIFSMFTVREEELGITGISLDVNPGGQVPHELVVNSMRLLADKVIPAFK